MAPNTQEWPIYFVPGRETSQGRYILGHTWRVAARSTSFYLKTRHLMQDWKISLHGPDEKHPGGPMLKLGPDRSFTPSEDSQGSVTEIYGDAAGTTLEFEGETVAPGVRRVIRLRWSWEMFQDGAYTEQSPDSIKRHNGAKLLTAPQPVNALDVDFFLSDDGPYWPNEEEVRRKNAGMGPLQNSAGQFLTAVVMHNSLWKHPSPAPEEAPFSLPTSIRERVRGFHATIHPDGYLHHEEIWWPRVRIDRLAQERDQSAG
jgi:hypothetical protein